VGRFLEERTEKAGELESVSAAVLFQSFKNWATDNSEFVLSNTLYSAILSSA
jgi:hypothetical protein